MPETTVSNYRSQKTVFVKLTHQLIVTKYLMQQALLIFLFHAPWYFLKIENELPIIKCTSRWNIKFKYALIIHMHSIKYGIKFRYRLVIIACTTQTTETYFENWCIDHGLFSLTVYLYFTEYCHHYYDWLLTASLFLNFDYWMSTKLHRKSLKDVSHFSQCSIILLATVFIKVKNLKVGVRWTFMGWLRASSRVFQW